MTAPNFDCDFTDDPVCPHCGHEETDAWEYGLGDGERTVVTCNSCDGMFGVTASISYSYSTEPTTKLTESLKDAKRQAINLAEIIRIRTKIGYADEKISPYRDELERAQALIAKLESETQ